MAIPNSLAAKPTTGVTIAPPAIPIIIKDDISLFSLGLYCKAIEKMIEKTLAQVNPTNATPT